LTSLAAPRLLSSRGMCGRFTLTYRKAELLAAELGVPIESLIDYRPRFNIAPTDPHWIVRTRYEDREILPAKWGLINFWMKDRKQAFKKSTPGLKRCRSSHPFAQRSPSDDAFVPADGFFEWTGPKENRQPIWFHRSDGGLISFAGLYESWRPSPTEKERTFTIVTTAPNALLEPIHNRMPVILEEDAIDDWLYARQSPNSVMELLRPAREDLLVATPVSARVNSLKNDDPGCLEARESGDTTGE
jgi:putative SOS response-associated peptidase YedK